MVVLGALVGFTCGPLVGVQPWVVTLCACAVLVALVRCVPWGSVPLGSAAVVLGLGVLASATADHLPMGQLLHGAVVQDMARDTGLAALGANLVNNLPALLVALPKLGHHSSAGMWAVLLGVNVGPVILVTGSLASRLWLATLHRLGVPARARDFARIGASAGLPGAAAGVGVALALGALGLH